MLADEAPNVVSAEGFRLLLDEGYQALVVCHGPVEKKHNQWAGSWTVRAVAGDRRDERLLVVSRRELRPREFKTTLGLIGFFLDMGFASVSIPIREGGRTLHGRDAAPDARGPRPDR